MFVSVCAHVCKYLPKPEEGIISPGDRVTGGSESSIIGAGTEFWSFVKAVTAFKH